ncbi:alpha/beta hydrolase [Jannaschia donghaensis]|uniref:Alpha/beta hydrolase family protein n=1 Tax=Jannaschia donghaensis TaxID=420998 RepID=A0A0M6YI69_9RHOB|nr:alpha/beta hydrolase [Jannaschia donghaensis]CTQ49213.1 hypothetical protein JDO7802_01225 [Jannaschia donghaensis]
MALTIDTVLEDRDLTLRWLPGSARRMVVVFTGRGAGFGGAPLDEFAGSAARRGENNVLFVTDRRGSWYSAPGLWSKAVRLIRYLRRSEGIEEVVSLGNSMGGYGALLLPQEMRVRRAIAFSPQLTLDRDLTDDGRWPDVMKRYGWMPARNVGETFGATRTQYYLTAGKACREDLDQLDFAPDLQRVHRWTLPAARHNVAGRLKDAGLLYDVIGAIIRGRKARVETLYQRYAEAADAPRGPAIPVEGETR